MARPAIHPGEIPGGAWLALGVTPTALARRINLPPHRVTQIIKGQRGMTGERALRLGHGFGTSARFWLNLQSTCERRLAKPAGVALLRGATVQGDAAMNAVEKTAPVRHPRFVAVRARVRY